MARGGAGQEHRFGDRTPAFEPKGVGESIYSGFTHNPHHLILDSVIDPKGYPDRGEHLFWIHTQSSIDNVSRHHLPPVPDFGLSVRVCSARTRGDRDASRAEHVSARERIRFRIHFSGFRRIGERGFRKLRLYTAELQWVAKTAPTRRAKKIFPRSTKILLPNKIK